jgi:hypothetical protein
MKAPPRFNLGDPAVIVASTSGSVSPTVFTASNAVCDAGVALCNRGIDAQYPPM